MAVRDDRSDVKQTTTGFRGPLIADGVIPHLCQKQIPIPNLLRSIQSANVSPLSPGTKVDWGVNPEQLFFFDNSGKRL
jgi:hypothetical protein